MQTFLIDCAMFIKKCSVYTLDDKNNPFLCYNFDIKNLEKFIKGVGTKYEECKILLTGAPAIYLEKAKKDIYEIYQTEFNNNSKKIIVEIV